MGGEGCGPGLRGRRRQAIFIAAAIEAAAFPDTLAGHSAIPVVDHSAREQPAGRLALPRFPLRRFREGFPRRAAAVAAALAIELLILWALLSLGVGSGAGAPEASNIATFDARTMSEPETEPAPEIEPAEAAPATPQEPAPTPPQVQPQPSPETATPPAPPVVLPRERQIFVPPAPPAPPQPEASPAPSRATAVIRPGAQYGPADRPRGGGADSEVVGAAPDGSPLYAARWYREPSQQELAGYLSGARGPGWGLIACRTAPDWRVEDCAILGESPAQSNIATAAKAAAWQFLVRPPRVGGEYQVGAWVRIRITYAMAPGAGG